jgi:tetratricopeptide (TPR) repeat protein
MLEHNALDREDRQRCRVELVGALRAVGRPDSAIELASRWCVDEPDNGALRGLLTTTLLREGRHDDALSIARRWYDESSGVTERNVLLEVLTESKQYDRATQYLLQWLQDDPLSDDLLSDLIAALIAAERFDDALELAEANYDRPGNRILYEFAALQAYNAAGRHDDAIRLLRQWIYRSERGLSTEFPLDLPEARRFLVVELMAEDRVNDARQNLNRWLDQERNPLNKVIYLTLLSECDRRAGRLDQSFESLELAHSLNPLDVMTCNGLGYTWADAGRRLDEAEAMIRFAVANDPRNAAYLDSLGWVLYKKADFEGAVYWLKLARGADRTDDPVILDHLGDALWRAGQTTAAAVEWRAAANAARRKVDEEKSDDPSHLGVLERAPTKIEAAPQAEPPAVAPVGSAGEQA